MGIHLISLFCAKNEHDGITVLYFILSIFLQIPLKNLGSLTTRILMHVPPVCDLVNDRFRNIILILIKIIDNHLRSAFGGVAFGQFREAKPHGSLIRTPAGVRAHSVVYVLI